MLTETRAAIFNGEDAQRRLLNTSTLHYFLAGKMVEPHTGEFASSLNLDTYLPFLQPMHRLPEKLRTVLAAQKARPAIEEKEPEDILDRIMQSVVALKTSIDDVSDIINANPERFRSIYSDPITGKTEASPIVTGTFTSVHSDAYELKKDGKDIHLEIHTHPFDGLLSPDDYARIIERDENGKRIVKGAVVVCPTIQILALATAETPLLSKDEAVSLIRVWLKRHSEHPQELRTLKARATRAKNRFLKGDESKDFHAIFIQAMEEHTAGGFVITNNIELELASILHIKLYSSTNLRDFREFSA